MKISFVLPIHNEEKNIPILYEQLLQNIDIIKKQSKISTYELIFVDDGSRDNSLAVLSGLKQNNPNIKIIKFSRNFGHEIAVCAGIDHSDGDITITMDADLQDPPNIIPQLVDGIIKGDDIVYAKRRKRDDSFMKNFTAIMYYKIIRKITNINIPENTGNYRAFNKKVLQILKSIKIKNRFFRGIVASLGFKQSSVEFDRPLRIHGETKYTISKMISLAWDGITSLSFVPLKFATWFGFSISIIAFLYILILIIRKFIEPGFAIQGWTSNIIIVLFLGGIQLIILGILGEYIGRIFIEVQNKPLYFIDEII